MDEITFLNVVMNFYFRQMRLRFHILILLFISGSIYSCKKDNVYPIEPEIEFSEVNYIQGFQDTVDIVISFTDGDGDIGLDQGDTLSPYNNNPSNYYYSNFYLNYFENIDGVWEEYTPIDTNANPVGYRIPNITPQGQNKSLKGIIQVGLRMSPVLPDSFYVEIVLIDRALHISNVVESTIIYK